LTADVVADGKGDANWTKIAFNTLAQDPHILINPVIAIESGAGYASSGDEGHNLVQLAGPAILPGDDLIVLAASRNDAALPLAQVKSMVHVTLGQVYNISKAKILVIGPMWAGPNPPPEVGQVRDVVAEEAKAVGADFVDPLNEKWLSDPSMVDADGIHPNDAGHEFFAAQIGPLIKSELQEPQTKIS
jgi:lysophospholipase L1-like esterase